MSVCPYFLILDENDLSLKCHFKKKLYKIENLTYCASLTREYFKNKVQYDLFNLIILGFYVTFTLCKSLKCKFDILLNLVQLFPLKVAYGFYFACI